MSLHVVFHSKSSDLVKIPQRSMGVTGLYLLGLAQYLEPASVW